MAGRPRIARAREREFWRLIRSGVSTADAGERVGVASHSAKAWFRHAGGMPPLSLDEPSGRYLSMREREEIAVHRGHLSQAEIARRLGRSPATISRELARNAPPCNPHKSRATSAQGRAGARS